MHRKVTSSSCCCGGKLKQGQASCITLSAAVYYSLSTSCEVNLVLTSLIQLGGHKACFSGPLAPYIPHLEAVSGLLHYVPASKSQHSAAVTAMSLADTDPDMELVRKLHLELNGSGRRTRGGGPPPSKRFKRDTSRGLSEGGVALQVLHQGGARSKFLDTSSVDFFSP